MYSRSPDHPPRTPDVPTLVQRNHPSRPLRSEQDGRVQAFSPSIEVCTVGNRTQFDGPRKGLDRSARVRTEGIETEGSHGRARWTSGIHGGVRESMCLHVRNHARPASDVVDVRHRSDVARTALLRSVFLPRGASLLLVRCRRGSHRDNPGFRSLDRSRTRSTPFQRDSSFLLPPSHRSDADRAGSSEACFVAGPWRRPGSGADPRNLRADPRRLATARAPSLLAVLSSSFRPTAPLVRSHPARRRPTSAPLARAPVRPRSEPGTEREV